MIAEVEIILQTNPDKQIQDKTRCAIVNATQNFINKLKSGVNKNQLTQFCNNTAKSITTTLKQNPSIRILPADKGNRTVVMEWDDYRQKMNELLQDTNTYKQIEKDPTRKYQTTNNNIAQRLLDMKVIDYRTASTLKTHTAICPRIYGQPKVHKPTLPLRPVVPNISSPTYQLSKFISCILQSSFTSKYNVSDSFSFCTYINNTTLPPESIMISLDVISLFTNIPQELITKTIIDNWEDIKNNTPINLDMFLEIVTFCMEASYSQFDGKYYQQVSGTAMGSPLSPILADMVLENLIDTVLATTTVNIPVIKKYVDDFFLIVPENTTQHIVDQFNHYHKKLQFTYEEESNNQLAYLDMTMIRKHDQTIRTKWYSKDIASGRILNYKSFHPLKQKMNTMLNFMDRVNRLSTDYTEKQKFKIITSLLKQNDYPKQLVNRCWNRIKTKITPNEIDTQTSPQENLSQIATYRSIPYIEDLSPRIAKILRRDYANITLAYSNNNTVNRLLPTVKDKIPKQQYHNIIYRIPCHDCESSYIGMTTNFLKTRLSGHQSNINLLEKLKGQGYTNNEDLITQLKAKTALLDHCISKDHTFDLTKTSVIDHTYKKTVLPILEMCHIFNAHNAVNKRTDVDGLNHTYAGLLSSVAQNSKKQTHIYQT